MKKCITYWKFGEKKEYNAPMGTYNPAQGKEQPVCECETH